MAGHASGAGRAETMVEVPQRPSGLGWTPDGALLVVSMLDRHLLRVENGTTRVHADLSAVATAPCNDMVVDGRGRAYVGNFGYDRHKGYATADHLAAVARHGYSTLHRRSFRPPSLFDNMIEE